MVAWNAVPGYIEASTTGTLNIRKSIKILLFSGASSLLAARYSKLFFVSTTSATIFSVAASLATLVIGIVLLQVILVVGERKPIWDTLSDGQRKLLGMAPAPRQPAPTAAVRPLLASHRPAEPLVTPPPTTRSRAFLKPITVTEEPLYSGQQAQARTPGSARHVTPDQLQRMMYELDSAADSAGKTAAAAGATATLSPIFQAASNTYRPSAVRRGTAATPVIRSDGRVSQSLAAQRAAVMSDVGMSDEDLEAAVEDLREWFASDVLQPLQRAIESAHSDVIDSAAQIGLPPSISLTALSELGTGRKSNADDSLTLAQIRGHVEEYLRNPANQGSVQLLKCKQATITYQKLLLLLRGEFIAGLLPPTPDGYIVERLMDLANGSCMMDFKWNGGGSSNGKDWSSELPTDSALLLYLFAAFLAAPKWAFSEVDPARIESPGGILVLGKMPPRVPPEFAMVVGTRLPPGSKGTGIVALQLGTREPHFCLFREGENVLTEMGHSALFYILVLFLKYCFVHGNTIGGRSLALLNAQHIVAKRKHFKLFSKSLGLW